MKSVSQPPSQCNLSSHLSVLEDVNAKENQHLPKERGVSGCARGTAGVHGCYCFLPLEQKMEVAITWSHEMKVRKAACP